METCKEFYNIVVLGAMNPRIHTPAWYRLTELIDDREMTAATDSPHTLAAFAVAQFEIAGIRVFCTQERWEVQSSSADHLKRMRNMTARLFDDLLPQTPVTALGCNFNYEVVTKVSDIGRYLASCVATPPIGLSEEGVHYAELSIRRTAQGRDVMIAIRPSNEPASRAVVSVSNNFDYRFGNQEKGYVTLANICSPRFEADQLEAMEQTSRVVHAINLAGEAS